MGLTCFPVAVLSLQAHSGVIERFAIVYCTIDRKNTCGNRHFQNMILKPYILGLPMFLRAATPPMTPARVGIDPNVSTSFVAPCIKSFIKLMKVLISSFCKNVCQNSSL